MVKKNIVRMVNLLEVWLEWLPVDVEKSGYKHLLDYIGFLQNQDKSISQMNRTLQAISHYYQFKGWPNVALTTRVKLSAERYRKADLEDLKEQIKKYHPLN